MSWSQDDNFLVSASADGSAKCWDLSNKETDYADKLNYTENDAMFFITQLLHSSFVHAAKIFPENQSTESKILVATACFDQKVRLWQVPTDQSGIGASLVPIIELSLTEAPLRTLAQKSSIYDTEQLDDDALAIILKPDKKLQIQSSEVGLDGKPSTKIAAGSVFDKLHPNCLVFSDSGRLFVGDSQGSISVWDVSLRYGNIVCENHFKITHKEIEGD